MVTAMLAGLGMLGPPALFIDDDPRLATPCTVWESSITVTDLIRRFAAANHLRLRYACSFPSPRLTLCVAHKPAGRALRLVADCLDLDWRPTNRGYELFLPEYVAAGETAYDGEVATATVAAWRARFAEWRAMKAIPWREAAAIVAKFEALENPYDTGIPPPSRPADRYNALQREATQAGRFVGDHEAYFVPFAHAADPATLERLEKGETVIAGTTHIPGVLTLSGGPDDYPGIAGDPPDGPAGLFTMAVRLDLRAGGVLYAVWHSGSKHTQGYLRFVPLLMNYDYDSPFVQPDSALGRRVSAWVGTPASFDAVSTRLVRLADKSATGFAAAGPPPRGPGAMAARIADATGLAVMVMNPPQGPGTAYSVAPSSLGEALQRLRWEVAGGIWHADDESIQCRPAGYRYRDAVGSSPAGTRQSGSTAASPGAALKEVLSRLSADERWTPTQRMSHSAGWQDKGIEPPMVAFLSSLAPWQVKRAIRTIPATSPAGAAKTLTATPGAGLPCASLSASQQALAQDALRSMCLSYEVAPTSREEWERLLSEADSSLLRLYLGARRSDVSWFFEPGGNGWGIGAVPSLTQWKAAANRQQGCRFVFRREWDFLVGFGIPGGPFVGSHVDREADVFGAGPEELRLHPDAVYARLVQEWKRKGQNR